ncbi:hypothetical protein [Nocardiopsis sp. NPDC006832]|uniref:hypothetical protein n=1 Tax=Nocardiopsis sp. NPDC006832 TaxID=3157188 RepID=UPI0033DB3C25
MTGTELWNRVIVVVLAASPRQALERIVMAVALVVLSGWFLISGLPHAVWLLPWGMALVGTVSSVLDVLLLALNDDNFDDEDEDGESGWELGA